MPITSLILPPVIKRDGRKVAFDESKIYNAILKAGAATSEFDAVVSTRLTSEVVRMALARSAGEPIGIEQIQDEVETQLIRAGYLKTARAYIIYREQRKVLRAEW